MNKKRLTICGSMTFIDEMEDLAKTLSSNHLKVYTPQRDKRGFEWAGLSDQARITKKREFVDEHLDLIRKSDFVLITNYHKHGVDGYVGANTLMEAAFAYALKIPIFVLFPVGDQRCKLELESITTKTFEGQVRLTDFV